jgi:hypothetical protein
MDVASLSPKDGEQLVNRLRELSGKANSGYQQALFELRALLADNRMLVDHFGNLTTYVEGAWLDRIAGDCAIKREAIREQLAAMKAALAGPDPSMIEQILADQIAINYVAANEAAQVEAGTTGGTPQQMALRTKRAESTQKRLMASIKMLTTLRAFAPEGFVPAERQGPVERPKLSA